MREAQKLAQLRRKRSPLISAYTMSKESGLGLMTVYALMDAGEWPVISVRSRRFVKRAVFQKWLKDSRQRIA